MRAVIVVLLVGLGACNQQPAVYPPHYKLNFMNACDPQNSANPLCACIWDRIEANVRPGDFAALEQLPEQEREAHPLMAQIRGYRETCNVELEPPASPGGEEPVPAP
jgi:hypothetical protein